MPKSWGAIAPRLRQPCYYRGRRPPRPPVAFAPSTQDNEGIRSTKSSFPTFDVRAQFASFFVSSSQKSAIFSVTCHQINVFLRPSLPFFHLSS